MSRLLGNPFNVIGASVRSSKGEIVELAELAELSHDHASVAAARGQLVNSRTRLTAELEWLPGVSPGRANQIIKMLSDPGSLLRMELGLPPIAAANAIGTALELFREQDSGSVYDGCAKLVLAYHEINAEQVLSAVNEDRAISGFPVIAEVSAITDGISGLRRGYVQSMERALDRLDTAELVQVVTRLADELTDGGTEHAPELLGELIDLYERKATSFLQEEAADIERLIDAVEERAKEGASPTEIDMLSRIVLARAEAWDAKAQPVQLLAQSRGLEHSVSARLAWAIRGLAIELFNEHDYLDISKRISGRLSELFAEVLGVAERVNEDIEALQDIEEQRRERASKTQAEDAAFASAIAYETTFGVVFKDRLSISVNGISWNGDTRRLDEIDAVSWGGLRGDYTTKFDVRVYSPRGALVIEFTDGAKFDVVIDKIWRAVGVRLLVEMLTALKGGAVFHFGNMRVSDKGVVIVTSRVIRAPLETFVPWTEARKTMQSGQLIITSNDGKAKGAVDIRQTRNAPVLSTALDIYWKKGGATLSSILGK